MKLNPNIYLQAAEKLSKNRAGACIAVANATKDSSADCKYVEELEIRFKHNSVHGYWFSFDEFNKHESEFDPWSATGSLARQLMLLFMYEMIKDENRETNHD